MSPFNLLWLMSLLLRIKLAATSSQLESVGLGSTLTEDVTLAFDDITCPTEEAFCTISRYDYLDFMSWSTFDASLAAKNSLTAPTDADCAISSPNALFSWRSQTPGLWPRIVLNESTAAAHGIDKYFDFLGLAMKPMNLTQRLTRIYIHAYGIDFNVTSSASVWIPHNITRQYLLTSIILRAGPHPQHFLNITRIFPTWGKGVNMVEIYGIDPDGVDVPICIDNLWARFHGNGYDSKRADGGAIGLEENLAATFEQGDIELSDGNMRVLVSTFKTRHELR